MTVTSAVARPQWFRLPRARGAWMKVSPSANDTELVGWARRGEGEAIRRLVERYSARLQRYLTSLVGEPALAEDLLQDTWLRVVERLDTYDSRQSFKVWLFAVARHRAIDSLRQRARQRRLLGYPAEGRESEEGEWLDPLELVPADSPSPLEQLGEAELAGRVNTVFALLPEHYREVLLLRFQEELALEEIARLLRAPLSTVKTRVQRGLVLLRQRAESLGFEGK